MLKLQRCEVFMNKNIMYCFAMGSYVQYFMPKPRSREVLTLSLLWTSDCSKFILKKRKKMVVLACFIWNLYAETHDCSLFVSSSKAAINVTQSTPASAPVVISVVPCPLSEIPVPSEAPCDIPPLPPAPVLLA